MSYLYATDIVASLEDWLINNWPRSDVAFIPTAQVAESDYNGSESDLLVALQWIGTSDQLVTRANAHWVNFDFRLICRARDTDRLESTEIADDLAAMLKDTSITLYSRVNGTTEVGWARMLTVGVQPATRGADGVLTSVVDVTGEARTA